VRIEELKIAGRSRRIGCAEDDAAGDGEFLRRGIARHRRKGPAAPGRTGTGVGTGDVERIGRLHEPSEVDALPCGRWTGAGASDPSLSSDGRGLDSLEKYLGPAA